MAICPTCGSTASGRFCGTCGQLLQRRERSEPGANDPGGDLELVELPTRSRDEREPTGRDRGSVEQPAPSTSRPSVAAVLAIVLVGALLAGLLVSLQTDPEVVSAGRWRGDGSGTTSSRAALPEQVVWSNRRLGAASFDTFQELAVAPVGRHGALVLAIAGGYLVALDSDDGTVRWERPMTNSPVELVDGQVLVPHGPGIAILDAATGQEAGWLPVDGAPFRIVTATADVVVVRSGWSEASRVQGLAFDGTTLFERRAHDEHVWHTDDGPQLVLHDPMEGWLDRVDLNSGEIRRSAVDLPRDAWIRSASDEWLLLTTGSVTASATALWLATDRRIDLPSDLIADPQVLHADGSSAVVFGGAPRFRAPPQGNDLAVRIDGRNRRTTTQHLDAGFGIALGSRRDGTLAQSGSLVRLVDVQPGGVVTRWEESLDPTRPLQVVGDLVAQVNDERWRAWDADTGMLVFDVTPTGLPGPDRRSRAHSQPYLRSDGFVLDAADSLTQVIDPIDGQRVDIRNSVHVAATPLGDLVRLQSDIGLLANDGRIRWQVTTTDGMREGGVTVLGDHVVVVEQSETGAVRAMTKALEDGRALGTTLLPMAWWSGLYRIDERTGVVVGSDVAIIDIAEDGTPTVRWHAPSTLEFHVTPIRRGDQLLLLGPTTASTYDLDDGEVTRRRLPRPVHAVVAYDDATAYATSGDEVVAIDVDSFEERWAASVGARITSAPTLAGDRIYVGTEDGAVASVSLSGQDLVRVDTGFPRQPVVGAPTVANGLIYAYADRGRHIVALGSR